MGAQNRKGGHDSAFFLYAVFAGPMEAFVLDGARPLLPRLLLNAGVQFGVAGLGSVAVCILRRERLSSFGLRRKGALVCAAVCLLFHPMEISLWGVLESLTTFAAIYGMLLVKRETGNAWGCVAAFLLIWNAL